MNRRDPNWDDPSNWDDEVVPLDNLRPSNRIYSDVGTPRGAKNSSNGGRPRRPRQQNSAGAPRQRRVRQPQDATKQSPNRVRRDAPGRTGQAQRSQSGQDQTERANRQARRQTSRQNPDDFANRLARADRAGSAQVPGSGWRQVVHKATGGVVNLGPSSHERDILLMQRHIRRPLEDATVAVFSRKGGVGKTTISAYLGLTLATERGGRIVALDGDAEAGSLGWLLAPRSPSTLAALASAFPVPSDYRELRRFTTATPEGLEVIVGDPAEMGPVSVTGLEAVAAQLSRHYDMSVFDTGAGVTRATGRVLVGTARTLLLVMSPSTDSIRAAERTLAWLEESRGTAAREDAKVIAVINGVPANAKRSHIEDIENHFSQRCDAVVQIPWDAHLATGSSSVSLESLNGATREAFVSLAATVVKSLARPAPRRGASGARQRHLVGA